MIAYATTLDNPLGADSGVSVHDDTGQIAAHAMELTVDEYGHLAADAADEALTQLGFRRTGDWTESGGQWATEVEPDLSYLGHLRRDAQVEERATTALLRSAVLAAWAAGRTEVDVAEEAGLHRQVVRDWAGKRRR